MLMIKMRKKMKMRLKCIEWRTSRTRTVAESGMSRMVMLSHRGRDARGGDEPIAGSVRAANERATIVLGVVYI